MARKDLCIRKTPSLALLMSEGPAPPEVPFHQTRCAVILDFWPVSFESLLRALPRKSLTAEVFGNMYATEQPYIQLCAGAGG